MSEMFALPPIALADLPEETKDFILAFCNQHDCTPEEAVKQILDKASGQHMPPAASAPNCQPEVGGGDSRRAA